MMIHGLANVKFCWSCSVPAWKTEQAWRVKIFLNNVCRVYSVTVPYTHTPLPPPQQ